MEQINDVAEPEKKSEVRKLSKVKWCLLGGAIIIVLLVICSVFLPAGVTAAVRWLGGNDVAVRLRGVEGPKEATQNNLVEMVVDSVGIARATSQPVVLLKQKDGERYLPIWIGVVEVNAIAVVTEGIAMPRPLTPDLLCTIVDKLGGEVNSIMITDLKDNIFYAKVVLAADWKKIEIDSRPSDAIAIAIRVKTPIYVTKHVLDKAGLTPDSKKEKYHTVYIEEYRLGS